jgi:hypothetical protein
MYSVCYLQCCIYSATGWPCRSKHTHFMTYIDSGDKKPRLLFVARHRCSCLLQTSAVPVSSLLESRVLEVRLVYREGLRGRKGGLPNCWLDRPLKGRRFFFVLFQSFSRFCKKSLLASLRYFAPPVCPSAQYINSAPRGRISGRHDVGIFYGNLFR